ncbi:MAG: universal stress protein [Candidatus Hydrogenedentes bacterium]|nr:universal stress protein [Candidatus Hydrogenedentota bacterium]
MRRFKNILVCLDPGNRDHPALEQAVKLSRSNEAVLRVVTVHEGLPLWTRALLPSRVQDWEGVALQGARSRVEEVAAPLRADGLSVSSDVLVGQPFIEIIREVQAESHDLVLKDLEVDTALAKPAIGSTDMHLLRKCPCPVWLVKSRPEKPLRRVLAAVDPVPGDDEVRNALNTRILELATSLAVREQCKLYVVRAYESIGETFLATELESREYSEYMERIQMVRLKSSREFIGKFEKHCGEMDVRYVPGDPGTTIPEVARDEDVDLVIMGTVTRTGVPGFLMGRTAETVLRQVDCSVLGVKPKGFVSPI